MARLYLPEPGGRANGVPRLSRRGGGLRTSLDTLISPAQCDLASRSLRLEILSDAASRWNSSQPWLGPKQEIVVMLATASTARPLTACDLEATWREAASEEFDNELYRLGDALKRADKG